MTPRIAKPTNRDIAPPSRKACPQAKLSFRRFVGQVSVYAHSTSSPSFLVVPADLGIRRGRPLRLSVRGSSLLVGIRRHRYRSLPTEPYTVVACVLLEHRESCQFPILGRPLRQLVVLRRAAVQAKGY